MIVEQHRNVIRLKFEDKVLLLLQIIRGESKSNIELFPETNDYKVGGFLEKTIYKRIHIIGSVGSGKTTLAKKYPQS